MKGKTPSGSCSIPSMPKMAMDNQKIGRTSDDRKLRTEDMTVFPPLRLDQGVDLKIPSSQSLQVEGYGNEGQVTGCKRVGFTRAVTYGKTPLLETPATTTNEMPSCTADLGAPVTSRSDPHVIQVDPAGYQSKGSLADKKDLVAMTGVQIQSVSKAGISGFLKKGSELSGEANGNGKQSLMETSETGTNDRASFPAMLKSPSSDENTHMGTAVGGHNQSDTNSGLYESSKKGPLINGVAPQWTMGNHVVGDSVGSKEQ